MTSNAVFTKSESDRKIVAKDQITLETPRNPNHRKLATRDVFGRVKTEPIRSRKATSDIYI